MTERRKKLIEVSLPLQAINKASVREKSIRHGHPSTLHLWWARRPLASCRAVLFGQLVDDPSGWPEYFKDEEAQKKERERLHEIIERMVSWEASTNESILNEARFEIARSVARRLGDKLPPIEKPLEILAYLQEKAPPVYDPFCGGGSIPLEAQRLGLRAYGSDLNPVPVLITKALVEIPPKFAGLSPVNPEQGLHAVWKGAAGLAQDVRYYAKWMCDEAEKRIGHLYPKAKLEDGSEAKVIAWIWARTVVSPDPKVGGAHVPLLSTCMLSTMKNKKAWVEIVRDPLAKDGYRFEVKAGKISKEQEEEKKCGTQIGRAQGFFCVLTETPISFDYIRYQGQQKKLGARLVAVFAEGAKCRVYLAPTKEQETAAEIEMPNIPELDVEIFSEGLGIRVPLYGMTKWCDIFTARQMVSLRTFSDLIAEARERVVRDALASSLPEDDSSLADGGIGATAYADAVVTYLGFSIGKIADYNSVLCAWVNGRQSIGHTFARPALPMIWDFAEANPLSGATGSFESSVRRIEKGIERLGTAAIGSCYQIDASQNNPPVSHSFVSTDPPYYDNIGYADLSDFFYVWLRRSLRLVWHRLFRRVLTPKEPELIAAAHRHNGDKKRAEQFFMRGMSDALKTMYGVTIDDAPVTIFYAFKQSEVAKEGLTSTGWASFLQAVINAGFIVDGTWPIRTEMSNRLRAMSSNALASSIVLVCVKRPQNAAIATRREFIPELKKEMSVALKILQETKVRPVDMAQASIGPGIGVFSKYAKVLKDDDTEMTVRDAIARINEIRDQILSEEDAEYDSYTQFCIDWFQSFGMQQEDAGTAITMAAAYNLGLQNLENAGVFRAEKGKANIIPREKMPRDWRPDTDKILTHWECTQHLIRVLQDEHGGAEAAGKLLSKMDEKGDTALKLAHRLYHICEQKNWMQEALSYDQLAQEFSSIEETARRHQSNQISEQTQLRIDGT